jgi:hypothetical protein
MESSSADNCAKDNVPNAQRAYAEEWKRWKFEWWD